MTIIPALVLVATQSGGLQGQALLDDMSQKAVRFFWEQAHPVTGFTKDRAANLTSSDTYTVASVASTGFALAATAIGAERGWLDQTAAKNRARVTVNFLLTRAAKDHGWFYHFIDWNTGARQWNCEVSSIDTSILLAGALVAERYFKDPDLSAKLNTIIKNIDWKWMLTDGGAKPASLTFSMGYHPETGFINSRWDSFNELMMLYIQALGANPRLPREVWTDWKRPIIRYAGMDLLVGGPLFMHQMSQSFLSFEDKRDPLGFDYWVETRHATAANRIYCVTNPNHYAHYSSVFWGLTACDTPTGYGGNGAPGYIQDDGTVAPTCVAASVEYMPTECMATLDNIYSLYPEAYGRYGFSNGLNPAKSWIGPDVIGIDLGMAMCAIENRRDGLVHRMSISHGINKQGFRLAGFVKSKVPSKQSTTLQER